MLTKSSSNWRSYHEAKLLFGHPELLMKVAFRRSGMGKAMGKN